MTCKKSPWVNLWMKLIQSVLKSLRELQKIASEDKNRRYEIFKGDIRHKIDSVRITSSTTFITSKEIWVNVELYVYGQVDDLGGKKEPNVHLGLQDGSTLKIDSSKELLANEKINRLYKPQLVRIRAEKNTATNQLRSQELISFENYSPEFDGEQFQSIV